MNMHLRTTDWQEKAEATPEVFQLPKIAPQGLDGVGHFNYYDQERLLSFQWDGRYEQHVTVSHGGYGEPTRWTFDFREMWSIGVADFIIERSGGAPMVRNMLDATLHFKKACDNWIAQQESAA